MTYALQNLQDQKPARALILMAQISPALTAGRSLISGSASWRLKIKHQVLQSLTKLSIHQPAPIHRALFICLIILGRAHMQASQSAPALAYQAFNMHQRSSLRVISPVQHSCHCLQHAICNQLKRLLGCQRHRQVSRGHRRLVAAVIQHCLVLQVSSRPRTQTQQLCSQERSSSPFYLQPSRSG